MKSFDFQPRTRVVFGAGVIERLGDLARELNFRRTLLVADHGLVASGHVDEAVGPLEKAGVEIIRFHDFEVNPDSRMVENGTAFVTPLNIDSIIGLGGGSSLDCAKGINFLLTNGGRMYDYRGYGKATQPMLPMIAIPTTAGTGSEGQSYALISDSETHAKMARGDSKAAFRQLPVSTRLLTLLRLTLRQSAMLFPSSSRVKRGACSSQITSVCLVNRTISRRAARCNSALTTPAWRLRTRCSARRMPVPTR